MFHVEQQQHESEGSGKAPLFLEQWFMQGPCPCSAARFAPRLPARRGSFRAMHHPVHKLWITCGLRITDHMLNRFWLGLGHWIGQLLDDLPLAVSLSHRCEFLD